MISDNSEITEGEFFNSKKYAINLLECLNPSLKYHCLEHTINLVIPSVFELCKNKEDSFKYSIAIAAAFHDTGFLLNYESNESIGFMFAEHYIKNTKDIFSNEDLRNIKDAILATNLSQDPITYFSKVLRDADLSYIAKKDFKIWIDRLQEESKNYPGTALYNVSLNKKSWLKSSINFFQNHEWYTKEAKKLYQKDKEKNIKYLINSI